MWKAFALAFQSERMKICQKISHLEAIGVTGQGIARISMLQVYRISCHLHRKVYSVLVILMITEGSTMIIMIICCVKILCFRAMRTLPILFLLFVRRIKSIVEKNSLLRCLLTGTRMLKVIFVSEKTVIGETPLFHS
ncbi:hypothetical protein SDC9_111493 [bioreactor metagenome]|uniref:Uncharacterized protein n=1 Tax=bioreactor metagenome TaxID=1076179 RepID=A0A645BHF6_9ZZZZ